MAYYNFLNLYNKRIWKWHQVIKKTFLLLEAVAKVKLVAKFLLSILSLATKNIGAARITTNLRVSWTSNPFIQQTCETNK